MGQTPSRMARMARALVRRAGDLEVIASSSPVAPSILTPMPPYPPPYPSGSDAASLPFEAESSVYYSARIEGLRELRSELTELESDVESSRYHWSELSDDTDEQEPNSMVFESMKDHPQWGPLFCRQPYDQLEIGAKIAEGAMADIFEAVGRRKYDKETRKRNLMLKVFKKGWSLVDLQRMWPPGIASAEFASENFAPGCIDNLCWAEGVHLLDDGRFAFIFQRYWGDLRKLIDEKMLERNGRPPFSNFSMIFHLIKDIAKGMRKLHDMGILHNDLKAANVLVWHSYEHTHAVVASFECSVGTMGTGFWRAPEVLLATKNRNFKQEVCTPQTDVYSFAMTCYEVITGRIPFENYPMSIDLVLQGARPPLPNDLPYSLLNNLVRKCWHQDPSRRPSFAEIIEVLGSSHFSNVYNQRPYAQCLMARAEDGKWDAKMSPPNTTLSKSDYIGCYLPDSDFLDKSDSNILSSLVQDDPFDRSESLYSRKGVSFKQKMVEKPNLYLSCHYEYDHPFVSSFEKHFHLQQSFKECNVGVVFISKFKWKSFTSLHVMVEVVRMVREAKSRSDFKILLVTLDVSLAELDDPKIKKHIRKKWDSMELGYPTIIKAGECATAYEYICSCKCMVNTGLKDIEFLNLVFDCVRGLISAERNTENLKGNPPPISLKDSDTVTSSKIHKVKEKSIPTSMMLQSTFVNDPDLGGERKNKSAADLDNDKGDVEEEQIQCPLKSACSHDSAPKSQDDFQMTDALQLQLEAQQELENHVELDEICDTIMRIDNLEGVNDPHGNMEYDYESFKDQLYEDIKRIDCIEEIAIDHDIDTMILLHSEDIVILSFFDEKADMFEFYFKNREDMASIVGVGLEHASVILESGKVTIKEIIEEDWNQRWRSAETNSCEKRIIFKMKAPKASNAHEGLIHLDVELSSEKPLLWELTKYFSLRESIGTFVTKDIFAEYAQGVGTSSSTSLKNQGEGSVITGTWMWLTRRFLNGRSQENENGGSTSNQIEERVTEDDKKSATIVKLELLEEGLVLKDEQVIEPFLGTITSNLLFEFINDGGDRKDEKEIHITIGHVSFRRGRNKNGMQSPWYHDYFQVMFGLLDEEAYGELKRMSFKHLDMKSGMDSTKASFTHGQTRGAENMINGVVSFKPYGVGASGGCQGKSSLQNSEMTGSERGTEISNNYYTEGGLALLSSDDRFKIVCDYTVPEVLSRGPLPSRHFHDHHVMFQGTWLPMADEGSSLQFVEYTLQATRNLLVKGKRNQQKYTKTILVNHLMTHLDGKTYKLRERKTSAEEESKSILTESRSLSPFQWSVEPLVEIKDSPSEVTNATIEHVDQHQANNQSTRISSRTNRLINRGLRMVGRDRSTGSGSSSAETSVPESRQEVNGTSNPTRASSMRWSIG